MSGHRDRSPAAGRMLPAYHRDIATWVAFAALFAFGILNAALGPVLPYLRQTEHTSYLLGALHQVAFSIGGITAGIQASRSSAPRRRTIVIGLSGAATAGLLLGYGRVAPLTMTAAFLLSAFATAALIRIWAVLADLHHRHRAVAMTEGEVAVSLAGIVTPAVVSACASAAVGWQFSFVIAFVLVAAVTIAERATGLPDSVRGPDGGTTDAHRVDDTGTHRPTQLRTLTTIVAVVGLEFTVSFWAASYLHDDVGIAQDTAVALVSVLYAANLAGRLVASRLARRLLPTTVLRIALATALAGTPIMLVSDNPALATAGLAVTGIGIGGTFPLASALHVTASSRTADQALGQILTVAGIGQIVGPLITGALAQVTGLRLGLLVMPAFTLLAAATTWTSRRSRNLDATM